LGKILALTFKISKTKEKRYIIRNKGFNTKDVELS
jgi:hypothetical protein